MGSVVYMLEKTRKIGVSPKLSPKWKGPYLVLKKFGTVFEIQITKKKSKLVHFDLLKGSQRGVILTQKRQIYDLITLINAVS